MKTQKIVRSVWILEALDHRDRPSKTYVRSTDGEWGPSHLLSSDFDEAVKFSSYADAFDWARDNKLWLGWSLTPVEMKCTYRIL